MHLYLSFFCFSRLSHILDKTFSFTTSFPRSTFNSVYNYKYFRTFLLRKQQALALITLFLIYSGYMRASLLAFVSANTYWVFLVCNTWALKLAGYNDKNNLTLRVLSKLWIFHCALGTTLPPLLSLHNNSMCKGILLLYYYYFTS